MKKKHVIHRIKDKCNEHLDRTSKIISELHYLEVIALFLIVFMASTFASTVTIMATTDKPLDASAGITTVKTGTTDTSKF